MGGRTEASNLTTMSGVGMDGLRKDKEKSGPPLVNTSVWYGKGSGTITAQGFSTSTTLTLPTTTGSPITISENGELRWKPVDNNPPTIEAATRSPYEFLYSPGEFTMSVVGSSYFDGSIELGPNSSILKGGKEMQFMASSLSWGMWLAIIMVVIVVVKLADRVSWRTVLWPLKKAARKVEEEAKKVEEEWEKIE